MSNDEELVGVMRGLALIALVKLVRQSPTGFVTLTEDDFAAVDGLADTDKWTLEKDERGNVKVGFLPVASRPVN